MLAKLSGVTVLCNFVYSGRLAVAMATVFPSINPGMIVCGLW